MQSKNASVDAEEGALVIACAADDNFALPLAVTLFSALKNYGGGYGVEIYILDAGISQLNRARIYRVLAPFNFRLHWLTPNHDRISGLPGQRISIYYRLLLPELLPDSLEKVIYLDSDILVIGDLALLWEKDVDQFYFLAAQDHVVRLVGSSSLASHPDLLFSADDEYFNAGILVMNLIRLRDDDIAPKVIDLCNKWRSIFRYKDQDGLNAVAIGRWGKLDARWNRLVYDSGYIHGEYAILHYVSRGSKPWIVNEKSKRYITEDITRAHRLYDQYVKSSGWFSSIGWFKYMAARQYFGYILARHYYWYVRRPVARVFQGVARRLAHLAPRFHRTT